MIHPDDLFAKEHERLLRHASKHLLGLDILGEADTDNRRVISDLATALSQLVQRADELRAKVRWHAITGYRSELGWECRTCGSQWIVAENEQHKTIEGKLCPAR